MTHSPQVAAIKKLAVAPRIDPTAEVVRSTLGRYTEVGARTKLTESTLGDYTYIVNDGDVIYTTGGKFCSIAAQVRINPGNHPMHPASQSHFTYRSSAYFDDAEDEIASFDWRRNHPVAIGQDVWIGHGAIVLPGRSIGTGAVVAARAVVTRNVAPYEVVVGTPARVIKRRFDGGVAARLTSLARWDWSHDRLRRALPDFRALGVEAFLERYEIRS